MTNYDSIKLQEPSIKVELPVAYPSSVGPPSAWHGWVGKTINHGREMVQCHTLREQPKVAAWCARRGNGLRWDLGMPGVLWANPSGADKLSELANQVLSDIWQTAGWLAVSGAGIGERGGHIFNSATSTQAVLFCEFCNGRMHMSSPEQLLMKECHMSGVWLAVALPWVSTLRISTTIQ